MREQLYLPDVNVGGFRLPRQRTFRTKSKFPFVLRYHLVQTEEDFEYMIARLNEGPFAWDTETDGLKPELGDRICGHCFCAHVEDNVLDGFYVPIRHQGSINDYEPQLPEEYVNARLKLLFEDYNGGEVATYHRKFDAKMLRAEGIRLLRPSSDVAIEANIFDENEPSFKLKFLASKYCISEARDEESSLMDYLRKDARTLGMSFRSHSKSYRMKRGLDALTDQTYLQRFGYCRAPIRLAAKYGIHDAFYTWYLSRIKYPAVRVQYPDLWQREHTVNLYLEDMEYEGLPVDDRAIRDTHERTRDAVKHWLGEVKALVGPYIEDNWEAGDTDLRKLFYGALQLEPPHFTSKGQPSVDRQARQLLRRQRPEWAPLFDAIDQLAGDPTRPGLMKLHSTYAGNYLRYYSSKYKTINPSYNGIERRDKGGLPVTGRLSSSDPNVQNVSSQTIHLWDCYCDSCVADAVAEAAKLGVLPAKSFELQRQMKLEGRKLENTVSIRRYFLVPEGYVRVFIDFSQIELRVLAWFCQDPNLVRAYLEGIDVHQLVADQLSIKRKIAKQVNFGNSYGMTHIGLALRIPGYFENPEKTQEYAKQVLKAYFQKYPRILIFKAELADYMRANNCTFVNPFGRPRRIPTIAATDRDAARLDTTTQRLRSRAERMMMSSIISGTSADLMKESMIRTQPIAARFGGRLVQTIHDELVFDLPRKPGWAKTVVELRDAMEDWPFFSEDRTYQGRFHRGLPIKTSVELSTTTWEDKREIHIHDDGSFAWAA